MFNEKRHVLSEEEFALANVTYNRYYLSSGKVICENGLGKVLWYEMDSPDYFQFDEAVESDFLNHQETLNKSDLSELEKLKTLNQILNEQNIFAVFFPGGKEDNVVVFHKDNPNTAFLAEVKDINSGKFNQIISKSMLNYSEIRSLSEPMIILEYHDDGILAY